MENTDTAEQQKNMDPSKMGSMPMDKDPLIDTIPEPSNDAVYDKTQPQLCDFETEDDEDRYAYQFRVDNLEDDDELFEFDNLQQMRIVEDGNDRSLEVDNLDACVWFFKRNVKLVKGFVGDDKPGAKPPEGWQDGFDDDEMQEVVNSLLFGDIYVADGKVKTIKKRDFSKKKGKTGEGFPLTLKAFFNRAEVLVKFRFPKKESKHIKRYKKITGAAKFKKGRDGTYMPAASKKLNALAREIGVTWEGNPAAHLISMAMRERYDTTLKRQTKKLNR